MRLGAIALALSMVACHVSPTEPRPTALADGRWSGDGACLLVRNANVYPHTSTLTVGCGHGEFPTPDIRSDGTFDVDGTYRIEAGPVSIDPPPPAHFSGSLTNTTLTLTVRPSIATIAPATYKLQMNPGAQCSPPCV